MTLGTRRLSVAGELHVLGDKSISHRSLLFAAIADGRSTVRGVLASGDTQSTARVLRALGVRLSPLESVTSIEGRGLQGLAAPAATLDCGNSGTTARLLLGMLAAHRFSATLSGDASLSKRPMRRVAEPLSAMGARVELPPAHDGLPLTITGAALESLEWRTPAASAQIKSAILLAGLCGGVPVTVVEPQRSRDHTERMLGSLGVQLATRTDSDGAHHVALTPIERVSGFDVTVPGDPSSAAYFAALATLADTGELTLRDILLNPTRSAFIDVLRRMGADIAVERRDAFGDTVGDIVARPAGTLAGTTISEHEIPSLLDEIPLLACVAARADGTTTVRGASELRAKESDRIAAVVQNLRAVGVDAEELTDGLAVHGARDARVRGRVRTFGDHRIAMAFATLGAASGGEIEIDDPSCVAVSYPHFWRDLASVTRG